MEVSRDVIFDENHAYKRSKDIPIEYDDEDIPLFEEEDHHDKKTSNQEEEEEGPSVGLWGLDLGSELFSQTNPYTTGPFGISPRNVD